MIKTPSPIILTSNNKNYFEILINRQGYKVYSIYRGQDLVFRNLRKIWFKTNMPFPEIWYRRNIGKKYHGLYIVFDSLVTEDYLKWLTQKLNARMVFWYWNPVRNSIPPSEVSGYINEMWSYSPDDCKKYDLKYNSQFYFSSIALTKTEMLYDVFFLGRDKGRLTELLELKQKFESLNLNVKFHIAPNQRQYLKKERSYQKLISYDSALKEMARSRSILDILGDPNDGLSLRALESLFHKRKLITNCTAIVNYDFYDSQNIFILGKDDISYLPEFLESSFKNIDPDIVSSYEFKNWINRF